MSKDYYEVLRDVIQHTHGCQSNYCETVEVKEEFNGRVVWAGDVEIFDLKDHPKANQCFAWGFKDDAGKMQYVAVLKVLPVDTPQKAVQAYIITQHKK